MFEAFVDPAITSKSWFTKRNGRLETGKPIHRDWEMYGVSADVDVKAIDENRRILIGFADNTTAEWTFASRADNETLVTITNTGFQGDRDEVVRQAPDAT